MKRIIVLLALSLGASLWFIKFDLHIRARASAVGATQLPLKQARSSDQITGSTLGNLTDTRGFNGFAELTTYSAAYSGTGIYSVLYTRNKLGRIAQKTETLGGITDIYDYTYDSTDRLTGVQKNSVTVATYTYDNNNNRLTYTGPSGTVNGTYDNQDRLTAYGANVYTYTASGELLRKMQGSQTTTYLYDVLGNLKAVTLPDTTQIEYLVDGENRRIGKRLSGVLVQGFLYQNDLKPIAELDGNNNVVSRFIYGSRRNVADYMIRGGVTYRIISDHLGSPRLVVDVTTGAVAQRIDYDEFGVVMMDTNPGFQPFGFAGGLYDPQTRLTRFGARDYDAETGRWTIKDPLGLDGGMNVYGYVGNDPVNFTDPLGQQEPPPRNVGDYENGRVYGGETTPPLDRYVGQSNVPEEFGPSEAPTEPALRPGGDGLVGGGARCVTALDPVFLFVMLLLDAVGIIDIPPPPPPPCALPGSCFNMT